MLFTVIISLIKISNIDDSVIDLANYINTSKAIKAENLLNSKKESLTDSQIILGILTLSSYSIFYWGSSPIYLEVDFVF